MSSPAAAKRQRVGNEEDPELLEQILAMQVFRTTVMSSTPAQRRRMLNKLDDKGWTLLHHAAANNQTEIAKWLVSSEGRALGFENTMLKSSDREAQTALHLAAQFSTLEVCRAIVSSIANADERKRLLNMTDFKGWTVLYYAAANNQIEIVKWLLSSEGRALGFENTIPTNMRHRSALHLAAGSGNLDICNAIISAATSEELKTLWNSIDCERKTLFHRAVASGRKEVVLSLFLNTGEGGGFKDILLPETNFGQGLLHVAARHAGSLEVFVAVLNVLATDADEKERLLKTVDFDKWTVLHHAAANGRSDIVLWLLCGEGRALGFNNLMALSSSKYTVLHNAVRYGQQQACEAIVHSGVFTAKELAQLLNHVDLNRYTILHYAAEKNLCSFISWLLSAEGGRAAGFDKIFCKARGQFSALHLAAEKKHLEACKAIVFGCRTDNGERQEMINSVDPRGWTALHAAAQQEASLVFSWLLSEEEGGGRAAGFNQVLAKATDGCTALHVAAQRAHHPICLAIVNGCRVENGEREQMLNAVTDRGWTILHLAAPEHTGDFFSWVLSPQGGIAAGFDRKNITALTNDELTSVLALVHHKWHKEHTRPFFAACTDEERMQLICSVNSKGKTILHLCAENMYSPTDSLSVILEYRECDLIVNARDNDGMTALHRIAHKDNRGVDLPVVSALLELPSMDPNVGISHRFPSSVTATDVHIESLFS